MNSSMLRASVATLLVAAALSGCAVFPQSANPTADKQITADVETSLAQHTELQAPSLLDIQTINRVVYLNGTVATGLQRRNAELLANEVQGVDRVVNSIGIVR